MHRKAFYPLLSFSFWDVPFWAFFLFLFMTVESYEWGTFSDWIKLGHKGNSILYLSIDFLVGCTVWRVWNWISYELSSQLSINLISRKGFFSPLSPSNGNAKYHLFSLGTFFDKIERKLHFVKNSLWSYKNMKISATSW